MIIINKWSGFLGNNIKQIINAIHIALVYKHNIRIPKHTFFNTNYINISPITNNINIVDKDNFYYREKINVSKNVFETNHYKVIEILRNIFVIKNISELPKYDVVIHIRSGDIFNNKPHPDYIVPPLSYYTNIIDDNLFHKNKNIIIIAENTKNPTVNKLLELYPKIQYKQQQLSEDIKILLGANIVIESFGTFTNQLLKLSYNIKHIFSPSYQFNFIKKYIPYNIDITIINLDNYRNQMYPWKNTSQQNQLILNF